jgi:hypothetical protein
MVDVQGLFHNSLLRLRDYARILEWKINQLYPDGVPNELILQRVLDIAHQPPEVEPPGPIPDLFTYVNDKNSLINKLTAAQASEGRILRGSIACQRVSLSLVKSTDVYID